MCIFVATLKFLYFQLT